MVTKKCTNPSCSRAGQELPSDQFVRDNRAKSGLKSRCKECEYSYRKNWAAREESKKKLSENNKRYRAKRKSS